MEHLIATFLFQNRYCPLPSVGQLIISERAAAISLADQRIDPPEATIMLDHADGVADDFVSYISNVERIDVVEANARLERYCHQLNSLDSFAEAKIPGAGKFYVNGEGNLVFKQHTYPAIYQDSVAAEKVIHPDASHVLLVGDKESSTTLMTEYYNVEDAVPKTRWWIAALVLALIGLAIIIFYFTNESNTRMFGNASKPNVEEGKQTYTTPK